VTATVNGSAQTITNNRTYRPTACYWPRATATALPNPARTTPKASSPTSRSAPPTSGGWFLFGHRTLSEASEFDSWHSSQAEAQEQAAVQWGVDSKSWRADLKKVE